MREQWLHAIQRDTSKHFSVKDATKVCSLHFKKEEVKSLGIGQFTYIDGAIPSVFAWKRSSPRKKPPPQPRGNGKARLLLGMSAVSISTSETEVSMDRCDSDINFILDNESALATSENTCTSENRPSYDNLQKRLSEMEQILEDSQKKNEKLEAEVVKVRSHAFKLSEKCSKLESIIFSSAKFISDEDIAFYTGFPSYAAFMATYTYLNRGKVAKTFGIGVLFKMMLTLNITKGNLVMCRLRQIISQSIVGRIVISWVNFMYLRFGQLKMYVAIPKSGG